MPTGECANQEWGEATVKWTDKGRVLTGDHTHGVAQGTSKRSGLTLNRLPGLADEIRNDQKAMDRIRENAIKLSDFFDWDNIDRIDWRAERMGGGSHYFQSATCLCRAYVVTGEECMKYLKPRSDGSINPHAHEHVAIIFEPYSEWLYEDPTDGEEMRICPWAFDRRNKNLLEFEPCSSELSLFLDVPDIRWITHDFPNRIDRVEKDKECLKCRASEKDSPIKFDGIIATVPNVHDKVLKDSAYKRPGWSMKVGCWLYPDEHAALWTWALPLVLDDNSIILCLLESDHAKWLRKLFDEWLEQNSGQPPSQLPRPILQERWDRGELQADAKALIRQSIPGGEFHSVGPHQLGLRDKFGNLPSVEELLRRPPTIFDLPGGLRGVRVLFAEDAPVQPGPAS